MKRIFLIISIIYSTLLFSQEKDTVFLKQNDKFNIKKRKPTFSIAPTLSFPEFSILPVVIESFQSPISKTMKYGLNGSFSLDNKSVFSLGIEYSKEKVFITELLYAINAVSPRQTILTKVNSNTLSLNLGYTYYFVGSFADKGFKFYGIAGIKTSFGKSIYTRPAYDNANYFPLISANQYNFSRNAYMGLGIEQSIGKRGSLFCELKNNFEVFATGNYMKYNNSSFTLGYRVRF